MLYRHNSRFIGILSAVAVTATVPTTADAQSAASHQTHADHHVVEITAEDYAFRAPAEIPSGWTTFQLENAGEETHMLFIARLPEGVTYDDYMTGAVMAFDGVWQQLRDGQIGPDQVFPLLGDAADPWFWETEFMGGVGFLSPGGTGQVTVKLEPGNYIIECYMRTPEGEMHSMEGMIDPLTVTEERSPGAAPLADVRINLSEQGMEIDRELRPGTHTFQVHYADHPEDTFGHNVEVVRLDGTTTADEVMDWLSFLNVDGLTDPAPGTFLGGINQMPAGATGYFTTRLVPGRYLFISEYTSHLGVFEEVNVLPLRRPPSGRDDGR